MRSVYLHMNVHIHSHHRALQWKISHPVTEHSGALVIFFPNWMYGLLPYCGPGTRNDAWKREISFEKEICDFFNGHGIATLSLEPDNLQNIPTDDEIMASSYIHRTYSVIKDITKESGIMIKKTILFGHGFGSRMLCEIVSYGLKPAGYIIAGGMYTDIDSILTQKYLPLKNNGINSRGENIIPLLDPETKIIMSNLGKILQASRKGKGVIKLKDNGNTMSIHLPDDFFSENKSPSALLSILDAPCLILHGSGDLDIPVSNAFFLETKLRQKNSSISRIVILDKDHWFRDMPHDGDDRIIERITGVCIQNPVDHRFLKHCLLFIEDILKIRRNKKGTTSILHNPGAPFFQVDTMSGS